MSNCQGNVIATGTGFFISPDGVLVTNDHVIRGACTISVKLESGKILAVLGVISRNQSRDIALLKTDGEKLPFLTIGESATTEVGEQVAVVGNPLGLEGSVSEGVLSAKRELDGAAWMQITAAISPGSSGSPVVNSAGEVIGVATQLLRGGQSLNFAVPAEVARAMAQSPSPKLMPLAALASESSEEDKKLGQDPEFKTVFDVIQNKDHARAIGMLQSLIRKYPNNSQLKGMLNWQHDAVGFYDKVEAYLQQEIETNSTKYSNWEDLGDVYVKQGKTALAAKAYRQAVVCFEQENASKPVDGFGLWAAGELYRKAGDRKQSELFLSRFEAERKSGKLRNPFELSPK